MNAATYEIVRWSEDCVLIKDTGQHDKQLTITNDAERVVAALSPMLQGRRLEYLDSEGNRDQLLVRDGQFAGFAPAKATDETT